MLRVCNSLRQPDRQPLLICDGRDAVAEMVPDLGAVILDRAARPLVEPEIRGVDPELTSAEDDDVVRHLRTSPRELAVAAVVLRQHRETQRSSAPLTGEQRSIFIQQGPELDQLVNVKRGRLLHRNHSCALATTHRPALGLLTAPLPAPLVGGRRWCGTRPRTGTR